MKYYACNIVLKERSIHLIIFPGYSDYSKSNAAIRSHFRLNLTEQRAFQIIVMYFKKIMIWSIMPVILICKNDLYIWSYFLDIQTILSRMPQSAVISDLIWLSSVHFKSHPLYSEKIMIWSIMPVILFWKNDLYIWSYFLDIQTILSRMPQSAVISDLIWLSSVHFKS